MTNSNVTYSCGPLHMDEQRQNVQLEPTYNSSVLIQNVVWKTYRERWTRERVAGEGHGDLHWRRDMTMMMIYI